MATLRVEHTDCRFALTFGSIFFHGWSAECSHGLAAMPTASMALWMDSGRMARASAGILAFC
eukprot:11197512-Lingulodinium_polyedra.AAC.1